MKDMELIRTAVSKKYGTFKFFITLDTVTNRWMLWTESTPFENDHRFGGIFLGVKTHDEAVEYVKALKYGYVGAIKTAIH